MSVLCGGLELDHHVLCASGCLDPLAAVAAGLAVHEDLAGVVTKTITPQPRAGNEPPRICEAPSGMLNSIGLQNPGLDAYRRQVLPAVAALGRPVVVSVGGFSMADYERLVRALDAEPAVAAIELNVSCPNVDSGCISIGSDAVETELVTTRCRALTGKPLWVKLSPNVADVAAIGLAAEAGGADALVLVNTIRGLALDRQSGRPLLGAGRGGLSGPALRPVALAAVAACRAVSSIDIVGVGGICCGGDAHDFLAAGAAAVEIGTALFREPFLARRVRAELDAALAAGDRRAGVR